MYCFHLPDTHMRMSLDGKLVQILTSTHTETHNLPCSPATHKSQAPILYKSYTGLKEKNAGWYFHEVSLLVSRLC